MRTRFIVRALRKFREKYAEMRQVQLLGSNGGFHLKGRKTIRFSRVCNILITYGGPL